MKSEEEQECKKLQLHFKTCKKKRQKRTSLQFSKAFKSKTLAGNKKALRHTTKSLGFIPLSF